MTVSEEIDQFIAENDGNMRDAVNVALTRWKAAEKELERLRQENTAAKEWIDDKALTVDKWKHYGGYLVSLADAKTALNM